MANLKVKNGAGADVYLKASGAGTDDDPLVPVHDIDGTVPVSGPLTDDELRAAAIDVAIAERTVTTVTGTVATSGSNTIVAAPGVGQRIVLDEIFVQLEASTPTVVLVQNSAATIWRLRLVADGDHALWSFPEGKEHRLFENGALVLNLSGANQVGYTARYRLETV